MNLLILTQKVDRNDSILGFFHRWIVEFAKHCEKVTVICLSEGAHDLPENVHVLSLGKESGVSRVQYTVRFYRFVWKYRKDYDAVFIHMNPEYVALGGLLWRVMGKKVGLWYTHKAVNLRLRIAEKLAHVVFTASSKSFRLPSKKLSVLGHGIDTEMFRPAEKHLDPKNRVLSLITVGRISSTKNLEVILDASKILAKRNVPHVVRIVGEPQTEEERKYLAKIKTVAQEEMVKNTVRFVGPVDQRKLTDLFGDVDIFINASRTGSLDKAALEAMACGVPIMSSNEGVLEVLGGLEETLSFPEGDPVALADALMAVHDMKSEERKKMSTQLRDVVLRDHSINTLIRNILRKYDHPRS